MTKKEVLFKYLRPYSNEENRKNNELWQIKCKSITKWSKKRP